MRVAIHQPNYLPYIGFFQKMALADIFIILDIVQFSKDSYTQRTKLRIKNGWTWLTIPIEKKECFKSIKEIYLPQDNKWIKKHNLSILANYSNTPYYDNNFIKEFYNSNWLKLDEFNEFGIYYLKDKFGIETTIIKASELNLNKNLRATDLLIEIIQKVGGDTYISGFGGKVYMEEEKFTENGITLIYHKFKPIEYKQRWDGFEPHMSSIDLLFNFGKKSKNLITNTAIRRY